MRLFAQGRRDRQSGKILVLFGILLTVLFGLLGLVMDGGLMMASHRRVQNAADSAALAAAMDLMRGVSSSGAAATATTFVQTHNGLSTATVTVTTPPASGAYAGKANFVEVVVTLPYDTVFAHLNGASRSQGIAARAVAGFEPLSDGEGVIALDPTPGTGLTFNGSNARLVVNGTAIINAGGSGLNQYGDSVPNTSGSSSVVTSNKAVSDKANAYVQAKHVQVRGGVDTPGNFADYDDPASGPSPLYAGVAAIAPDPLRSIPVPQVKNTYVSPTSTTATKGTVPLRYPPQSVGKSGTVTFNPGVYEDINITGGNVTFRTGTYVLSPTKNNQGLRISGGKVQSEGWVSEDDPGPGVMFYVAASNYLDDPNNPGSADIADGAADGPLPPNAAGTPIPTDSGSIKVAALDIAGGLDGVQDWVHLAGLQNYTGTATNERILFFGRRKSQTDYHLGGNGGSNAGLNFVGTVYAKWANLELAGGASYNSQFVVGRVTLSGQGAITIKGSGVNRGLANQVYLVE